jgi:hypothetical protein
MTTTRVTYQTDRPAPEVLGPDYPGLAEAWLEATDSTLHIALVCTGRYFPDDKEDRDIYRVTLAHNRQTYTFNFGQSIVHSARESRCQPDAYSILACLNTYSPGTFEEWCGEFGYDTDSRKAEATYRAVCEQWLNLSRMYTPEQLDALPCS